MVAAFVVRMHREPQVVYLVLSGELDLGFLEALDEPYRRAVALCGPRGVVVDVTALEFCDLLGQRALLRYHGAGATLVGAPRCLRQLFDLTGQLYLLPIDPSWPWPALVEPARVPGIGVAATRRAHTLTFTREAAAGHERGPLVIA